MSSASRKRPADDDPPDHARSSLANLHTLLGVCICDPYLADFFAVIDYVSLRRTCRTAAAVLSQRAIALLYRARIHAGVTKALYSLADLTDPRVAASELMDYAIERGFVFAGSIPLEAILWTRGTKPWGGDVDLFKVGIPAPTGERIPWGGDPNDDRAVDYSTLPRDVLDMWPLLHDTPRRRFMCRLRGEIGQDFPAEFSAHGVSSYSYLKAAVWAFRERSRYDYSLESVDERLAFEDGFMDMVYFEELQGDEGKASIGKVVDRTFLEVDFDACMVAWDGERMYIRHPQCLLRRTLYVGKPRSCTRTSYFRLHKYKERDFTYSVEEGLGYPDDLDAYVNKFYDAP